MRYSIRNQVLLPILAIQAVAIAAITTASVSLAEHRTERQIVERLDGVVDALGGSSFPLTDGVLARMHGLSGAQFIAYDLEGRPVAASDPAFLKGAPDLGTISAVSQGRAGSLNDAPSLAIGGRAHLAVRIGSPSQSAKSRSGLLILYPESSWREARWESAQAPLILGAGALAVMAAVTSWIAHRISGRLRRLENQVARIAEGDFRELELGTNRDEVHDLGRSINLMCAQLREMKRTIARTERAHLLAQLAAGLAHQLRNALTGARMSIQLHLKRCRTDGGDASMDVALRQLSIIEEQVRGLLTLGRVEERPHHPCDLGRLVDEVASLVEPTCRHARVGLVIGPRHGIPRVLADGPSLRAAVLNLVLNAIEAAGPGGSVTIELIHDGPSSTIRVSDTGPGPPPGLSDSLFDPFVTGKPEGVGLGLALARQVAEAHDGSLTWAREGGWTRFRLSLPGGSPNDEADGDR